MTPMSSEDQAVLDAVNRQIDAHSNTVDTLSAAIAERDRKLAERDTVISQHIATISSLQSQLAGSQSPDRDKPAGAYKPGSSTTGIIAPQLQPFAGDYSLKAGEKLANKRISGRLIRGLVTGGDVSNVYVEGGSWPSPQMSAVKAFDASAVPTVIADSTIKAAKPSLNGADGIKGRDLIVRRCQIAGFIDGVGVIGGAVIVEASWIYGLAWYPVDGVHSDGSHCDCIQVHGGGSALTAVGNLLELPDKGTAGIMVNSPAGPVRIEKNWFQSNGVAGAAINFGAGCTGPAIIRGNVLSKPATWKGGPGNAKPIQVRAAVLDHPDTRIEGNVFEDGTPVPITRITG